MHFNEGKNKRVVTKMSATCHRALKLYAEAFHMTCSEVLYAACRAMFHKQAQVCDVMSGILEECEIPLDKRADRACFGYSCLACKHITACKCGVYKGVVEIGDEFLTHVNPSGAAALQSMQLSAGQRPQSFPQLRSFEEVSATQRDDLVKSLK